MDWIKVEDTEIVGGGDLQGDADSDNSGSDPLATVNVSSTNGDIPPEIEPSRRGEKRKSSGSTSDLYSNIKNRRNVVKRIAAGLRTELTILERRRNAIHNEFMQLKALNEYYKKLERSVLQIRQQKKSK